jgi:hypothetical protein
MLVFVPNLPQYALLEVTEPKTFIDIGLPELTTEALTATILTVVEELKCTTETATIWLLTVIPIETCMLLALAEIGTLAFIKSLLLAAIGV